MANADLVVALPTGFPLQPELQIVERRTVAGSAHALVTGRIASLRPPRRRIRQALCRLNRFVRGKRP